jgi:hypothetical protein
LPNALESNAVKDGTITLIPLLTKNLGTVTKRTSSFSFIKFMVTAGKIYPGASQAGNSIYIQNR